MSDSPMDFAQPVFFTYQSYYFYPKKPAPCCQC